MSLIVPIPPLSNPITNETVSLTWGAYFSSLKQYTDTLAANINNIFHNALKGLQGGQLDQYYHLTLAQYNNTVKIPTFTGDSGTFLNANGLFSTPSHNGLSSIQGGVAGEYYHLTKADYTKVKYGVFPLLSNVNTQFFNGDGKFTTPNHNDAPDIQGGALNDYQHLTTPQLNSIKNIPSLIFGYNTLGI
jgi:hypothetical protein